MESQKINWTTENLRCHLKKLWVAQSVTRFEILFATPLRLNLHRIFITFQICDALSDLFPFINQALTRIASATWTRITAPTSAPPSSIATLDPDGATFQSSTATAMVREPSISHFSFVICKVLLLVTENLLRGINDLIALVKKLQQDIANQHADIRRLQSLIENCAGCQASANLRLDTCQYANSCFPGKWIVNQPRVAGPNLHLILCVTSSSRFCLEY